MLTLRLMLVRLIHNSLLNYASNEHIDHSAVSITGGGILSGGGDLTASRTITLDNSDVDHDQTTNYVPNEHVNHSAVTISGTGRVSGGGDLTASRTLTVDVSDLEIMGSTGVIKDTLVTGVLGGTTFDVSAGVVDFYDTTTDPENPVVTRLQYAGQSGITVTNIATAPITYVLMDSSGTIIQQPLGPTPTQRRSLATLSIIVHTTGVVSGFIEGRIPPPDQIANQLQDFALAVGPINLSGNLFSPNGANLALDKSAGSIYRQWSKPR